MIILQAEGPTGRPSSAETVSLTRQAEVMMVRTLLIGRLSGVPEDVLRRRLRERYE